ncbi:MAG: hypothetical protein AAF557_16585 [Pseudomonadota bacterium]
MGQEKQTIVGANRFLGFLSDFRSRYRPDGRIRYPNQLKHRDLPQQSDLRSNLGKLNFKSTNAVEIVDAINRAIEGTQNPFDWPGRSGDRRTANQGRSALGTVQNFLWKIRCLPHHIWGKKINEFKEFLGR